MALVVVFRGSLNGITNPTCNNPSHKYGFNANNNIKLKGKYTCSWRCAEYEGAKPVQVGFTFIQNNEGAVWEFDSEIVSSAPSSCHN